MLAGVDALDEPRPEVDDPADADLTEPAERGPSLNTIIALILALVGLRIGLAPLHDNSFFTHLATGRIILDTHGIPRVDPYSFSAHGEPWTVQSWGASVIFAGIEKLVGLVGIRVLVAICCVALTQLVWRLTSTAVTLLGRLVVAVPVIAVGSGYWVERPLLFSLIFTMALLFALEDRLDPRWLVPIMWLWVNIHGSFPLAFVAIGVFLVGRLLDRERPDVELRVLLWAGVGTVVGAILSPIGWDLLIFPAKLLSRSSAFAHTTEWEPPSLSASAVQMYAVQLVIAVVLVAARRCWCSLPCRCRPAGTSCTPA